ncbi:MAG TPA: glycosyltransferase family 39 protein [Solirubrobacteraceae bacterium]|nr:glycosyltransferase family 39 protein [Solirubrobacteraceae bacterium]
MSSTIAVPPSTAAEASSAAARPAGRVARARALATRLGGTPVEVVVLLGLLAVAVKLRTHVLSVPYWIDEGISVGIASHHLGDIPGLLRQDGSPPLYYLLLHFWIQGFGSSEQSTHALSAIFAILSVPAAWWAARPFGRWAGLIAGGLLAVNPYVGLYADETRMYSLVLLLALLATGAFIRAFVQGRRPYAVLFAALLAALFYTHNWALFFGAAAGFAWLGLLAFSHERRRLLIDGVIGFGTAAVLFAPWLPTLAYQTQHTGAPWSHRPSGKSLQHALTKVLSGHKPELILLLVAAAGLVVLLFRRSTGERRRAILSVIGLAVVTLLAAWAWSRYHSPAWATRYFVIVLAPLAVALGAALGRITVIGAVVALCIWGFFWHGKPSPRSLDNKSNVAAVARAVGPELPAGTIVFSPQPEQISNLAYYLPRGLRYATPLGWVPDTGVMDWRDAMKRLNAAQYEEALVPIVRAMRPGQRLLLVQPHFSSPDAPWTRRIHHIAHTWGHALRNSSLLTELESVSPLHGSSRSTIAGILYVRTTTPGARHLDRHHTAARA